MVYTARSPSAEPRHALCLHRPRARTRQARRPPQRGPLLRLRTRRPLLGLPTASRSPDRFSVSRPLLGLPTASRSPDRFSVSRPTVYTWIERYRDGGTEVLLGRSHARRTQAHQTPPQVEALIVEARRAHPSWGPRKLLPYLAKRHPALALPAASTAGAILARHGLTKKRRPRRVPKHPGSAPLVTRAPNQLWTADFKGQFKPRDGVYC